jgi:glyoxylase-like metal-dependent hydrolase (beta-lactamase superfamily II)
MTIIPLHAANPSHMTGAGNWTYFMPGAQPLLIDAGVGEEAHLQAIAGARRDGPGHVVVSHAHGDHISGVPAIAARWPAARFSKYPWPDRDGKHAVSWSPLSDGEVIAAGDTQLQVVHTPGHAPDHVALWHAESRTLFSGDLVVSGTTVVIPASMGGSLAEYLQSLQRVLALAPLRLMPAHGDPIDDPVTLIEQYIQHRRQRDTQVLAAVRAGFHTAEDIVAHVYTGLAAPLVPMARESVLAHLRKLEDDGLVRYERDEWHT